MHTTTGDRISPDIGSDSHRFRDAPERPIPASTTDDICRTLAKVGELHPELDFLTLVNMVAPAADPSDEGFLRAAVALLQSA